MRAYRSSLIVLCLLSLGIARVPAAFPNAWEITDASSAAGSTAGYTSNLLAAQSTGATNLSFRYLVNARLADDFGGDQSLGIFYSTGTNRFGVFFDLDANGNFRTLIPTTGGPTTTLTLTTNAITARAYHTHEIVYSNSTKIATYSFDGVPKFTWTGDGSTGAVGQVFWGAASETGQGRMNFRLVRFQVNNTNVVIYDAGSSATNRPVAPDPLDRGWTFSNLGTGTATNAVSPDTFWNPTIILNGANPLQTTWTLPFTDPGALVTAPPVSVEAGRFQSLALKADGTVAGWGNFSGATNIPPDVTNVITLAAGDAHSLALKSDRTILAWGDNSLGQTNLPADATNIVHIAAGLNHNLALRADGTVVQWGHDSAITNAPASVTNVVAVAAGQLHCLALRSNGTVVAWGFATGQTNVPSSATNLVAIAAGNFNLALRSNGAVLAWGDNTSFQTNVPASASNVIAIAAGLSHGLALRTNGTVVAWGAGTNNTGLPPSFGQAIVPASATNVVAIAAGDYHSLALRADGTVIAWGAGTSNAASPHFGQSIVPGDLRTIGLAVVTTGSVDPNTPGNYQLTYRTTNTFNAVSVATRTVAVVPLYPQVVTLPAVMTNDLATLRGSVNPNGFSTVAWFEWGLGSRFDQKTIPAPMGAGSSPITLLSTLPSSLTPGLVYRGRLVASNSVGLVARCYDVAFLSPGTVALVGANPLTNIWGLPFVDPGITGSGIPVSLAGGRVHSLALKADGTVAGWGDNFYGQSTPPATANNVLALAAGQHHGLAVKANGTVVSWGENNSGQTNVAASATNVVAVAAGESYSLALRRDGTLVGWGDNFYGQATAPVGVTNLAAIAAGQRHSLALQVGGTMAAWGYSAYNQTNVPATATNIVAVAAGAGHSLALKADGTVFVWGLNSYYQTNLPASATNVVAIAAGFYHSLGLRADGTVIAWGAGTNNTGVTPHFGQSVVPSSATGIVAIAAGYYHSLAIRADGTAIAWGAGTASTGSFPNLGQAIPPAGLNTLNLQPNVSGAVNVTQPGSYPLTYSPSNPFGGTGANLFRTVEVTAPPGPSVLTTLVVLGDGSFRFNFTNSTPTSFTVLAATNVALPLNNWTVIGAATPLSPGVYQFTDAQATNFPQRYYQIRSP